VILDYDLKLTYWEVKIPLVKEHRAAAVFLFLKSATGSSGKKSKKEFYSKNLSGHL
jgi:hypothetical protein